MKQCLSNWILSLAGWEVKGSHPHEVKKAVCAVVPHTSWVDVPVGVFTRASIKADIKFLGKQSLFKPPYGWFFRWLGGYPVDRTRSTNFVEAVVDIFDKHEQFYIAITPEGTRKKTEKLKSGYYWIAKRAEVAIIMVSMDYENKEVYFHSPFIPTENSEEDMEYLESLVAGVKGRIPHYSFG